MNKKDKLTSVQGPVATPGRPITIRDTVVADPSIEFTVDIDPAIFPKSPDGVYLKDFKVKLSISDLDPDSPGSLTHVGTIKIRTITQTSAYFYFTFGDPDYVAGTKFTVSMKFSALDPVTGEPIDISDNPLTMEVYGGGVA